MRIAYITDTYLPEINGVTTSIINSTSLLADRGHKVQIHAPLVKGEKNSSHDRRIKVHRYSSMRIRSYRMKSLPYPHPFRMYRFLKRFRPDVIHIHTPGFNGLCGILCGWLLGVNKVATYHTYLPDFLIYAKRLFGLKGRRSSPILLKVAWMLTRLIHSNVDVNTVPTKCIKKILKRHGIRSEVISNGIDLDLFTSAVRKGKPSKFLHVGRLGHEKRTDLLLEAFALAAADDSKLDLTIIGDGPALDDLKEQARALNIYEKVDFRGFVPHEKLPEEYHKHDVFITPSPMETQGLVILEAMACGLPIVGMDKLAVPELVKDGQNGLVSRFGDVRMMSRNIAEIASMDISDISKKSQELVKCHDVRKIILKIEDLYQRIV